MADGRDGFLGAIFKKYGIRFICGVLVLGLVIWGASHIAAQSGTPVNVLWGMTSYTKSCSKDSEGVCKEGSGQCVSIAGRWQRSTDHLIVNYTQSGCVVQGYVESRGDAASDGDTSSHRISAVVSGSRAAGYAVRTINGCTTIIGNEYQILSKGTLEIKAYINGCNVYRWPEDLIYNKILQ
jgi:hypothetical protein